MKMIVNQIIYDGIHFLMISLFFFMVFIFILSDIVSAQTQAKSNSLEISIIEASFQNTQKTSGEAIAYRKIFIINVAR